ncbi:MAG: hypothetical protein B6229_10705 [Spirochaetaceae bacterium 4572_7]|nr:MAG: hypothetical protein B6229_10705 [Spirochaetaceae bacterium 4572_7]
MGLKGGDDSPYIRGIISILDLAGSNFNRKDIFDVISNPCFMSKFNITQTTRDFFLEIASELNIKWGIDGEHKKDIGYNNDNFDTWEAGFKRFLLGMALNREDNPTIPYSINDSSGSELIGEFVHIILLLDDLNNLSNFKNDRVPFPVFKSLLKEFIVKSGNSRGRYLTQGVTFSSLKPLRAVPFKHIFVLGLNEDEFPGRESVPSYDLRSIYDQKIDLSKRQNDKFAFLELILSAKDSLTLFYRGKNQVTGESLQPSVVINELLEVIANNFDNSDLQRSHLIEDHPLQNFDSKYFDQASDFISFNKRSFESAKAYIESKDMNLGMDVEVIPENEDIIEIKVSDIIHIYENREIEVLKKWKLADLTLQMGLEHNLDTEEFIDSFFKVAKLEGLYKDSPLTNNVREDIEDIVTGVGNFLIEHNISGTNFKKSDRELNGDFESIKLTVDGQKVSIIGDMDRIWTNGEKECFIPSITLGKAKEMKVSSKIIPYIYSLLIFNHKDIALVERGLSLLFLNIKIIVRKS